MARPDLRGSLISAAPTLASLGMVISYAKGAFISWRMVAWLATIYTVVPVIFIHIFVPESPVWLVSKGSIEEAARSLKFLYKNYPQPEHTVICLSYIFELRDSYKTYLFDSFLDAVTSRYASEQFAT